MSNANTGLSRAELEMIIAQFDEHDLIQLGMVLDPELEPDKMGIRLKDRARMEKKLFGAYGSMVQEVSFDKLVSLYMFPLRMIWGEKNNVFINRKKWDIGGLRALIVEKYGHLSVEARVALGRVLSMGVIPTFECEF